MGLRAQQLSSGWLTEGEEARLTSMRQVGRRQEFVACRYALRCLMASVSGTAPENWRLEAPGGRAPHLNAQHHGLDEAAAIHFSLSHSSTYLACVSGPRSIGVDMEVKDVRVVARDVLALAAMACTGWEMEQLRAIHSESARYRLFLQWWTIKESYFKCMGTGIDYSTIRHIECRPFLQAEGRTLACAKAWKGTTAPGQDVLLSVCVLGPDVPLCEPQVDADIEWLAESDWCLVAVPPD